MGMGRGGGGGSHASSGIKKKIPWSNQFTTKCFEASFSLFCRSFCKNMFSIETVDDYFI